MADKLDAAYMKEISKGFKTVFNNALNSLNKDYQKVATQIRSNVITTDYTWLGDTPSLKEWVGDRTYKDLTAYKYSITKKNWEASLEVDRDVIAYDSLGVVKPRIQMLAEEVERHYNELIFGLLTNNGTAYDGKNFFATDHSIGGTVFSNLLNLPLTQDNFQTARQQMRGVVDENGRPLFIKPSLLVVPPELEFTAIDILKADKNAQGGFNRTYNMAEVLVCDWLSDPKAWYLLDCSKSIKPFILQINKEVEFVAQDKPDSEHNFNRRKFRYGIDTEDNAGYALWQLALKSTGV